MNEWIEFFMILLVLGCIIGWVIIGIGILTCRMKKKCPKARICKNTECRWGTWCVKHQRYSDREKFLFEIAREYQKKNEVGNQEIERCTKVVPEGKDVL